MKQRTSTGRRAAALACIVAVVCVLAPAAQGQARNRRVAYPDNAVTSESLAREMRNPAVRRLQRLYADTGATTEQVARLREIDARAFAMRRFATADDLAQLRAERAAVLTPEQLEKVSRAAAADFRDRLAERKRSDEETSGTAPDDAPTTATAEEDAATTTPEDTRTTGTESGDPATTDTGEAAAASDDNDAGTTSAATPAQD